MRRVDFFVMGDSKGIGAHVNEPNPEAFAGIQAKIIRAQEHLDFLESGITTFIDRQPYISVGNFNADATEYIYKFRILEQPPLAWAVVVGEFIHSLRSALEQAVYQLTILHAGRPLAGTGFPIFKDRDAFNRRRIYGRPTRNSGAYQIRGIRPTAKAFVESVQPYNSPNPDDNPLWAIQKLWNKDKHRLPLFFGGVARESMVAWNPPVPGNSELIPGPKQDGAELAKLTFTKPSPHVKVEGNFTFQIFLEGSWDPDSDMTLSLRDMYEATLPVLTSLRLHMTETP